MRYLVITPDYTQSCIRDEFEGVISLDDLSLPKEFIDEISIWHDSYRKIIPLGSADRKTCMREIEKLDMQGIKIAKQLSNLVPGGAKVKYFSEGKLRYLQID